MNGKPQARYWWVAGLVIVLLAILFSCLVAAFVGGVAGWVVARQRVRPIQPYSLQPWVMPPQPWSPPDLPQARPWQWHLAGGAMIIHVEPGSPADRAGLSPGDVVVAVGDWPLSQEFDLRDAIRRYRPGDLIAIELQHWRTGTTSTVEVRLGSHPDDPQRPYLGVDYQMLPTIQRPAD